MVRPAEIPRKRWRRCPPPGGRPGRLLPAGQHRVKRVDHGEQHHHHHHRLARRHHHPGPGEPVHRPGPRARAEHLPDTGVPGLHRRRATGRSSTTAPRSSPNWRSRGPSGPTPSPTTSVRASSSTAPATSSPLRTSSGASTGSGPPPASAISRPTGCRARTTSTSSTRTPSPSTSRPATASRRRSPPPSWRSSTSPTPASSMSKRCKPHVTAGDPTGATWLRSQRGGHRPVLHRQARPRRQPRAQGRPRQLGHRSPTTTTVDIRITTGSISSLLQSGDHQLRRVRHDQPAGQLPGQGRSQRRLGGHRQLRHVRASPPDPPARSARSPTRRSARPSPTPCPTTRSSSDIIFGRGSRDDSIVSTTAPEYTPAWSMYTTDMAKAKSLMSAAGNPTINVPAVLPARRRRPDQHRHPHPGQPEADRDHHHPHP